MSSRFYSKKLFKVIVTVAILGLLVFLNPYNFVRPFCSFFSGVMSPLQKITYNFSLKIKNTSDVIFQINNLKKDNENLLKENQTLLAENAKLNNVENENEFLREQLRILPREQFNLEAAAVVGQDSMGLGNWIEIDKGKNYGIEKDMSVIISGGILVGKVSEVFATTSKIILISNPENLVNALDEKTSAKGIIRGEFGLGVVMDMVLQTDLLNKGDQIITSGIGAKMPRGLLIGRIDEIGFSQDRLFQRAVITVPMKFSQLQFVFVIKD